MKVLLLLCSLVCWAIVLTGCKSNEPQGKITPGNLSVETTITTDGSGLVTFHATSANAVKFTFYYGEGLDNPFTSTNPTTTHTYLSSGTYPTQIIAYSADSLSVQKTESITVQVNEPPIPPAGYTTPATYAGMTLVWQDEFNGDHLNTSDWNYETGAGTIGGELEYFQEQNTSVQDGYLIIKAKLEKVGDRIYTSSKLNTQAKETFQYGRVDIRALVPKGQGLFPALWMLGSSFSTVGWPKCGEIDIMETVGGGGRDSVCYGTAHWDSLGHIYYGGHRGLTNGHVLGDQFHVFSIVWNQTTITWYLDDVPYHVIDITPVGLNELKKEFFFIFNVAVGGDWPGSPDATTVFPQRMVVDYIRVFQ
jgi:hypothetical protein